MADAKKLLGKVAAICLALPEASVDFASTHAIFRVRKKVFAYFLNNHHGDKIISVCCKTRLGENRDLAAQDPRRFYLPAYIGVRGWIGIRMDRGKVDWREIEQFVAASYDATAPKKLVAARERTR